MKVIGILILVFGLLLASGGSFLAVRSYGVTDPMGECTRAGRELEKADLAVQEWQGAKGTAGENEARKKATERMDIAQSAERFCAEMKETVKRNAIVAAIVAGFGFLLSIGGIMLAIAAIRRRRALA